MFTKTNFVFVLLTSILLSSLLSIYRAAQVVEQEEEPQFGYQEGSGNGPEQWANINPNWKVCGDGKMQSPIDLLDNIVQVMPGLGELQRDYRPAPAKMQNKGHVIAVEWIGHAGTIHINGTNYSLKQCHWHSPSEHYLGGSRHNLELHMFHMNSNGGAAVVGITYKFGSSDPFLAKLIPHIPSLGTEDKDVGVINPGDIDFGSTKEYYRYMGSLTTPPCKEDVVWTIVKEVRTVSSEQVMALKEAVRDGYEENARPLQQLNGRTIWLYTP